ncbi:tyrosine-type recombinase/integrase [Nostoc sp. NIES-2111]
MPRDLPRYVYREIVAGHAYLQFRRGKEKRIRLPDDPKSEEFLAAYAEALAGAVKPGGRKKREKDPPRSLGALITLEMSSVKYRQARASTKVSRSRRYEIIRKAHGHRLVAGLTPERITKMLQPYADRPGEYVNLLKLLRRLIKRAIGLQWLTHDPAATIDAPTSKPVRSWTDEEIATFRGRWPLGTKQRTAFEIHLCTGMRRSDVHRVTWADIRDGKIKVQPLKTGERIQKIRIHRELQAALDATARDHIALLTTAHGAAFSTAGYSNWIRDAIREAGLPEDCRPHGLRKAAGRRLAEAGCSARQIMAVLGHPTLSEAERYTADANQERLAEDAIRMHEAQSGNEFPQNDPTAFGETPENPSKTAS